MLRFNEPSECAEGLLPRRAATGALTAVRGTHPALSVASSFNMQAAGRAGEEKEP